jgi:hypothetical protein
MISLLTAVQPALLTGHVAFTPEEKKLILRILRHWIKHGYTSMIDKFDKRDYVAVDIAHALKEGVGMAMGKSYDEPDSEPNGMLVLCVAHQIVKHDWI